MDADSDEIRAALHARLEEEDEEIRMEAVAGLAMRDDPIARDALERELALGSRSHALESAAEALGVAYPDEEGCDNKV